MLEDLLADRIQPRFEAPRAGDVVHSQADIGLARQLLGYEPEISFKEGLKETVEWFRKIRALDLAQSGAMLREKNRDLAASR